MPYAIIRSAGKQFRVQPGQVVRLPSLEGEAGGTVTFGDVLLHSDGSAVRSGTPSLAGASVTGEIVRHGRGDKIVVFKFKRRKNYSRKQGHRQGFTEVRIRDITLA
jgi:large subunit ribosomal protein L21